MTEIAESESVEKKCFVFVDDETSLSLDGEAMRYKAVVQGERIGELTGLKCIPVTTRTSDGTPITDVAQLAQIVENAICSGPVVAIVVDVIQHRVQRQGLLLLEHMKRFQRKAIEALRGIVVLSKDSTVKDERKKLVQMFPNQEVVVLDRITELSEVVSFLVKHSK